jgi:hypothetical protein
MLSLPSCSEWVKTSSPRLSSPRTESRRCRNLMPEWLTTYESRYPAFLAAAADTDPHRCGPMGLRFGATVRPYPSKATANSFSRSFSTSPASRSTQTLDRPRFSIDPASRSTWTPRPRQASSTRLQEGLGNWPDALQAAAPPAFTARFGHESEARGGGAPPRSSAGPRHSLRLPPALRLPLALAGSPRTAGRRQGSPLLHRRGSVDEMAARRWSLG